MRACACVLYFTAYQNKILLVNTNALTAKTLKYDLVMISERVCKTRWSDCQLKSDCHSHYRNEGQKSYAVRHKSNPRITGQQLRGKSRIYCPLSYNSSECILLSYADYVSHPQYSP
jgi:hypothetical protein